MKKLMIVLYLLSSLTVFGQDTSNTNTYIQLSSVYYSTPGHVNVSLGQRQMIWDQGRYLTFINSVSKIVLKAYSSSHEYKSFGGDKLLTKRINNIKNILIKDCGIDSTRFIIMLIGDKMKTNNNPIGNQRVDIEITN